MLPTPDLDFFEFLESLYFDSEEVAQRKIDEAYPQSGLFIKVYRLGEAKIYTRRNQVFASFSKKEGWRT